MKRRQFIGLLGGAAAWPLPLSAQQALPVLGFLNAASRGPYTDFMQAFHRGLGEAGFVEGRSVTVEYRWAEGRFERLPTLARELVQAGVAAIAAVPASAALAAKAATATIPIVFMSGPDPVRNGLVQSLNRPGGNATGVSTITSELAPKRLQVMRDLVPEATGFAFLVNPRNPRAKPDVAAMQSAAGTLGQRLVTLELSTLREIELAFGGLAEREIGALIVGPDPFFNSVRPELGAIAARHRIPAMFPEREYVKDGGLLSYGASLADAFRQVGVYAGRVLNGEKPVDLPVLRPVRFELVFNLKAAKAIGFDVPPTLLARADEVIE
jgi:putative ABC transport system substrate-binding protein